MIGSESIVLFYLSSLQWPWGFAGLISPHCCNLFTWSPPACWNSSCLLVSPHLTCRYWNKLMSCHIHGTSGSPAVDWRPAVVELNALFQMTWISMSRLSSAFWNIGNCRYKCLCVVCDSALLLEMGEALSVRVISSSTMSPPHPWVTFIDKVFVVARLKLYVDDMWICFVLQLLGAAFLAIGLWAWKEKVRANTGMQPEAHGGHSHCNSMA